MNKKLKIRLFYENEYAKFPEEQITDFKYKCHIGGDAYTPDDITDEEERYRKLSPSSLSIAISKREKVPQSVLDACDRICWYLKHSFGDMTVIKVPFEEIITFAICVHGYADDGWDNYCSLIEIYDDEGELIGSSSIPDLDEPEDWRWMNRTIKSYDFNSCTVPKWSEDEEKEYRNFEIEKINIETKKAERRWLDELMNYY